MGGLLSPSSMLEDIREDPRAFFFGLAEILIALVLIPMLTLLAVSDLSKPEPQTGSFMLLMVVVLSFVGYFIGLRQIVAPWFLDNDNEDE